MNTEPKYWTCGDGERLTHTDIHDAVIDHIDNALYDTPEPDWPETVTVVGYAQDVISDRTKQNVAERALETVIEYLDEDYGPDEGLTGYTDEMREAAKEFIEKIVAEFPVWRCTEVTRVEVNLSDFKEVGQQRSDGE